MTKEKLDALLSVENGFDDVVKAVSVKPKRKQTKYDLSVKECNPLDEYNVHDHPVFDKAERKDVIIKEKVVGADGKSTLQDKGYRKVNRIGIAIEEMIVGRAAAFLCGLPVRYSASPTNDAEKAMLEAFKKVDEQNKLDFKNLAILKQRMSELEVAEIWFLEDLDAEDDYWSGTTVNSKQAPRLFIAAPSLDDKLFPVWDNGVLIALGREWIEIDEDGKDISHFDLYTKDTVYEGIKIDGKWQMDQAVTTGKQPVIYHNQSKPEWDNARTEIRRIEFLSSNHADSNDKTMSPILFVKGKDVELPKGEAQRAMKGDKETDAYYVTADNAPQSLKLEMENLWKFALETTNTVDISPETVKGIGQLSGVALELLFLPAMLKAAEHAGTYGETLQRRVNLIKHLIVYCDPSLKAGMSLQIKPQFDYFLPKDIAGITNYLATAITSGIISKETATNILQGALGGDGGAEMEKINAEPKPDPLGNALDNAA